MILEIKVPGIGESVQEGMIETWHKTSGSWVEQDEVLLELETDKATVEVVAEKSGLLKILVEEGKVVKVGQVIATIDSSAKKSTNTKQALVDSNHEAQNNPKTQIKQQPNINHGPAVQRMAAETNVDLNRVSATGRGGRITKEDIILSMSSSLSEVEQTKEHKSSSSTSARSEENTGIRKEPMSMIRRRISERLLYAQQNAAILTTFNEVDMTALLAIRNKYKEAFQKKHNVKLGFMGFFLKASEYALQEFPRVNAYIEEDHIVYHDYQNIGVAVSTDKGLMVPVVKDVQRKTLSEVEKAISSYAQKARDNKISLDDLQGGTFTVSNGGVFGSLVSTPILKPPQSAILVMHKIQQRPVVTEDGKIEARPMMYLALSYDHRIIDGKESVSFLIKIKEALEDPSRLVLGV